MKNNRKYPRTSCSETTFFSTQTMVFEGLIKNKSLNGVYIESFLGLQVGQNITVALPSIQKKKKEVKIEGKVVRTDEEGFGVEFRQQMPLGCWPENNLQN